MRSWIFLLFVPAAAAAFGAEHWFRARKARARDAQLRPRAAIADADIAAELSGESLIDEESVRVVRTALARCTGIENPAVLRASDRLLSLRPFGLDDIGMVEFVMEVEEKLGVKVPTKEWSKTKTIADVILTVTKYRR